MSGRGRVGAGADVRRFSAKHTARQGHRRVAGLTRASLATCAGDDGSLIEKWRERGWKIKIHFAFRCPAPSAGCDERRGAGVCGVRVK